MSDPTNPTAPAGNDPQASAAEAQPGFVERVWRFVSAPGRFIAYGVLVVIAAVAVGYFAGGAILAFVAELTAYFRGETTTVHQTKTFIGSFWDLGKVLGVAWVLAHLVDGIAEKAVNWNNEVKDPVRLFKPVMKLVAIIWSLLGFVLYAILVGNGLVNPVSGFGAMALLGLLEAAESASRRAATVLPTDSDGVRPDSLYATRKQFRGWFTGSTTVFGLVAAACLVVSLGWGFAVQIGWLPDWNRCNSGTAEAKSYHVFTHVGVNLGDGVELGDCSIVPDEDFCRRAAECGWQ